MTNINNLNCVVVGTNNIGLGLTKCLLSHKVNVVLTDRDHDKPKKLAAKLGLNVEVKPMLNSILSADVVILAADDKKIESLCKSLSINLQQGCVVAHCSEELDSSILESAASKKGVSTCSLTLFNNFTTVDESIKALGYKFHRTYAYSEGDRQALDIINPLFEKLGFQTVEITTTSKPIVNAASTFAKDCLTTLMEISMATAEAANLDRTVFWRSLKPITKAALLNIDNNSSEPILNGPIAAGDTESVAKHLNVLKSVSPKLANVYAELGTQSLSFAIKRKDLDSKTIAKMHKVLKATREE